MNETLKSLREKFNYSQNSVAQYLGISRQMYIKYEKGDVEPSLKVITNLSALYKVPCELLISSYADNSKVPEQTVQTAQTDDGENSEKKSDVVYRLHDELKMKVSEPSSEYSADNIYYKTVISMFRKMVFSQQLKVFSELAGLIQKHSEEIADSMLETKREKDPLQEIWARADAAKDKISEWKWNREELYDREICKHRGE